MYSIPARYFLWIKETNRRPLLSHQFTVHTLAKLYAHISTRLYDAQLVKSINFKPKNWRVKNRNWWVSNLSCEQPQMYRYICYTCVLRVTGLSGRVGGLGDIPPATWGVSSLFSPSHSSVSTLENRPEKGSLLLLLPHLLIRVDSPPPFFFLPIF